MSYYSADQILNQCLDPTGKSIKTAGIAKTLVTTASNSGTVTLGPYSTMGGKAICGTIASNAAVTVQLFFGPNSTTFPYKAKEFTTSGTTGDGNGDAFDVKVLDTFVKIVLTGTASTFIANFNLSNGEG